MVKYLQNTMDIEDDVPLELRSLTFMMTKMFGENTISCLKDKYDNGIRGFLESTSAVSQCKNVIKNFTDIDERTGNPHACWICGLDIIPGDESFKPECEHIFPIAQAVIFIGLYREEDVEFLRSRTTENIKDVKQKFVNRLKPEYGWAHRLCNQVKSDTHFVELASVGDGSGTSRWTVSKDKITKFLQDILNENQYGNRRKRLQEYIRSAGKSIPTWLQERTTEIFNRCNEVLATIPPVNENLALLASVASLKYDIERSGCVEEEVAPTPPTVRATEIPSVTPQYSKQVFQSFLEYAITQLRPTLAGFVTEKLRSVRSTPEDRLNRASLIFPIINLSEESKEFLYKQIIEKFNSLKENTTQPFVLLNELTLFGIYSALVGHLKQVQSMYQDSKILDKKVTELETTLANIRTVRPQYAGSHSIHRRGLYTKKKEMVPYISRLRKWTRRTKRQRKHI